MSEYEVIPPQSCVLFATADWDEPYWTNKQHCAKSLSELGSKVLYVESVGLRSPKIGSIKDWGRLRNRLRKGLCSMFMGAREHSPRIFVLSPLLVPAGHRFGWIRGLNRFLLRIAIVRALRQHSLEMPLIWTYHPFMLDVIDGLPISSLLYHCVDDIAAIPGVDAESFRMAERQLLIRADIIFATAISLFNHCKQYNNNTHYLPNVVDAEHFGLALKPGPIPGDLALISEPRLCYHGVLSDFKIDFQLLLDAALLRPDWSWVFIGEEREGQKNLLVAELQTLPNVHFLGYKPYAELPSYLRGIQVGLLPSLVNDYTRGMFPMKYFEYLAAGIPVVSTALEFTKENLGDMEVAVDKTAFIEAIDRQLKRGKFCLTTSQSLIASNTWIARLHKMLKIISKEH
jgi:glycosyltransferase involved in cell wall biosynthesis